MRSYSSALEYALKIVLGTVKLAHFSVKEYLISADIQNGAVSQFGISESVCHEVISQTCVAYLLQLHTVSLTWETVESFPLAEYSSEHWVSHVRLSDVNSSPILQSLIWNLFRNDDESFINWARLWNTENDYDDTDYNISLSDVSAPIIYASRLGLSFLIPLLLRSGVDVNVKGNNEETALIMASLEGYETIVGILLASGADVSAEAEDGQTALYISKTCGAWTDLDSFP